MYLFTTLTHDIGFLFFVLDKICPPGTKGPGGICQCSTMEDGPWSEPKCNKGLCKANQDYEDCVGKKNGTMIGDGFWCWNNKRGTRCPMIPSNYVCLSFYGS